MEKKYNLKELADILQGETVNCSDVLIEHVVSSGNHKIKNSIFVAYKGVSVDGHDFIKQAFQNGSVAAVVTNKEKLEGCPGILVKNSKLALSKLCAFFNGYPSDKLLTIGITGTNGKTTIHWLLSHALDKFGFPSIRIGSLGIEGCGIVRSGKAETKTGTIFMTTPGACEIHSALNEGLKNGAKAAVIETSSHALMQYRVTHVNYNTAVFTNLTPEHLNYHKTVDEYFKAKVKLFKQLAKNGGGSAVVNSDCQYGKKLIDICNNLNLKVFSYGKNNNDLVKIIRFKQQLGSSTLILEFQNSKFEITTNLVGEYNGYNIAAAFGALVANNFKPSECAKALSNIPSVPGRLEFVGTKDIGVFIDYAHTGDGLENVLSALKPFAKNNLWVLFGCGGGKDKGKRIAMGNAAKKLADKIVLTNDNPKLEDPEKIIEDILESGCKPEFVELDRKKAIEQTLKSVKKGDVVVLAGKGHEDYQIIGTKTIPFSDKQEALRWRDKL